MGVRHIRWWSVAISLAASPAVAQSDAPLRLAPASDWVIDYDDDSCALRRLFGPDDQRMVFELRQFSPGDGFQVTVASSVIEGRRGRAKVRFEPDEGFFQPPHAMAGEFGEQLQGLIYNDSLHPNAEKPAPDDPPPEQPVVWPEAAREGRERAITGLHIAGTFERDVVLETGSMRMPMGAMRTCMDELLTHWGIDVEAHRTLSREAAPANLQDWARRVQQRYPAEMVRTHQNGYIRLRLIVGPDGRVAGCHAQLEAQHPSFSETACQITSRYARFNPALDAKGEPIASFYTTAIIYQIFP